ncbi:MAG: DUF4149 domain-containing protein [Acidiferrobacter sp.]
MSAAGRGRQATTRILAALWIGGLWVLGFVVAPLLFARLPLATAGAIAGGLFALWQGVGLFVGAVVFLAVRRMPRPWPLVAATVWGLDAVFELGLLPVMGFVRATPHFGPGSALWGTFLALHTVAVALYFIEGVLGLALVGWAL